MSKQALYNSIQSMPAKPWLTIIQTNKLHHLYKSGKGPVNKAVLEQWMELQQQWFDEFGVDDAFKIRLHKMKQLTEMNLDYIINGDRSMLNHIELLDAELNPSVEAPKQSPYKLKDAVEKYRKYHIDLEKTMVIEWGYMVRDFDEAGRRAKSEEIKQKTQRRGK